MKNKYDVIIIGAGAAGLFCAFNAANKGKRVLVLDHANKVGKKILMSGGGRCNFTNLDACHEDFSSNNPHFCKSALNQYSPYDFLALVEKHNVEYVEKEPLQLFCKHSAKDILKMLLDECAQSGVKIFKKCSILQVSNNNDFLVETSIETYSSKSLVVATGGLSIPTLGATGYGYELAQQFGHEIIDTQASLVPFTLTKKLLEQYKLLSGVALPVTAKCILNAKEFVINDDMLFTHRGLSGPAILKLSAYWRYGSIVEIDMLPGIRLAEYLKTECANNPDQLLVNKLAQLLPKKLAKFICEELSFDFKLKQLDKSQLDQIEKRVNFWQITPAGTEGYRTAEVTSGGVNTDYISSKTLQSKHVENLFFIGEVLDVTGQLGGYNFQWAWSSAWCAAQAI